MPARTKSLRVALVALVVLPTAGPAAAAAHRHKRHHRHGAAAYSVSIRYTAHDIPHILARDYGSLGYGYGYAFAKDNICTMADSYATVRAQRARYFGPSNNYSFRGNGTTPNNLNSDFFYQRIIDDRTI